MRWFPIKQIVQTIVNRPTDNSQPSSQTKASGRKGDNTQVKLTITLGLLERTLTDVANSPRIGLCRSQKGAEYLVDKPLT